jgi:hypothetical protein
METGLVGEGAENQEVRIFGKERCSVVVNALCYKQEGRWFETR